MHNHHGWQLALDVQMDQLRWQNSDAGNKMTLSFFEDFLSKNKGFYPELRSDMISFNMSVRQMLARGDTIYVTSEMEHLLLQAAHDLPEDATFDIHTLITPVGFCMLEEPIVGEDRHGRRIVVSALGWHVFPVKDEGMVGLMMYFFTPTDDISDDINKHVIPWMREKGMTIPPLALVHVYPTKHDRLVPEGTERGSEITVELCKLFISMQLVAQQKIGEPMKLDPDRASRKRYAREFPDNPPPMITLITLRRKSIKKEGDPTPVPWSRRWVVRGHWRKQWYPKLGKHQYKYIYEYVKGPEDKPLIITERRVFNFRR